jgi:hypothetical protein
MNSSIFFFFFFLQYLLGWLVLLLNPIPDGKVSSLNKCKNLSQMSFLKVDQKNTNGAVES